MRIGRMLRGVLGVAAIWGVLVSGFGVALRLVRWTISEAPLPWRALLETQLLPVALYGLQYGALMGAAFACIIIVLGRKARSVHDLSVVQVALAGGVLSTGLHWMVTHALVDPYVLLSLALGVSTAGGSVILARHAKSLPAAPAPRELPVI